MKRNSCYSMKKLNGVPYLLPCGQAQADHRRGMALNETGEFLWDLLAEEKDSDELLTACAKHYEASPEELPLLRSDLEQFLGTLLSWGILVEPDELPHFASTHPHFLSIAGLNLCLHGPDSAFPEPFSPFLTERPETIHQTIGLLFCDPPKQSGGRILLRSEELVVIENPASFTLLFPTAPQIAEAHLAKDGSLAAFYVLPPFHEAFREQYFHAVRLVFLYLLERRNMAVIHSASVLYRGKAWLFSGSSGTGKSTHTGLWNRVFHTPVLNGDLNLLALDGGQPVIHGLPWCGTSGISDTASHPLGGIILLKQSSDDRVESLSDDRKILLVQQRLITPSWTEDMLDANLRLVERLIPHILVCRLHCTAREEAARVIRAHIDFFLEPRA